MGVGLAHIKREIPIKKIQRKEQSKLHASNFPMWVGNFANSHLCEAPLKDHKSPSQAPAVGHAGPKRRHSLLDHLVLVLA